MKCVSHLFSKMSGKLAGIVYYNGLNNVILGRQWFRPTQRNTLLQQYAKSSFAMAAAGWTATNSLFRYWWQSYAANYWISGSGRRTYIAVRQLFEYLHIRGLIPAPSEWHEEPPDCYAEPLVNVTMMNYEGFVGTYGIGISVENLQPWDIHLVVTPSPTFNLARLLYKGPWQNEGAFYYLLEANQTTDFVVQTTTGTGGQALFCRLQMLMELLPIGTPPVNHHGWAMGREIIWRGITAEGNEIENFKAHAVPAKKRTNNNKKGEIIPVIT